MHLVIMLYVLFASIFSLQKVTLSYCEPFFSVGSRMLFAGIILIGYVLIRHKPKSIQIKAAHLKGILLLAISMVYLTNTFEIWAIKHMPSSKVCLLYSLSPFMSALVAFFVLNERLSQKKLIGMAIGFLGLLPLIFMQSQQELGTGTFLVFTLAELSGLGMVFCSVLGWIMLKKVTQDYQYTPLVANGLGMIVGGLLALLHSYFAGEHWTPLPITDMQPFLIITLIICIISNLICYNLYGYLLKRFTATFMSFAGLVTPIFASLIGFLWLKEVVTWHYYLSIMLFSLGMIIFYREEIGREKVLQVKGKALANTA